MRYYRINFYLRRYFNLYFSFIFLKLVYKKRGIKRKNKIKF